jgi:hypothetical protein
MIRLERIKEQARSEAREQVAAALRSIWRANEKHGLDSLLRQTGAFVQSWRRSLYSAASLENELGYKVFRCPLPMPIIAYIGPALVGGYELRIIVHGSDYGKDWCFSQTYLGNELHIIGERAAEFFVNQIEHAVIDVLRNSLRDWMTQITVDLVEALSGRL